MLCVVVRAYDRPLVWGILGRIGQCPSISAHELASCSCVCTESDLANIAFVDHVAVPRMLSDSSYPLAHQFN